MPVWGESDEPRNRVEMIADTMLAAADQIAERLGVNVTKAIVAVVIDGTDKDEPDGVNAGSGYKNGEELLRDLVKHTTKTAEQLGIALRLVRIGGDE